MVAPRATLELLGEKLKQACAGARQSPAPTVVRLLLKNYGSVAVQLATGQDMVLPDCLSCLPPCAAARASFLFVMVCSEGSRYWISSMPRSRT